MDHGNFLKSLRKLSLRQRERMVLLAAEEPVWAPVQIPTSLGLLELQVARDYFGIDGDVIPITPVTAMHLCDKFDAILPTTRLVDALYAQATHLPRYTHAVHTFDTIVDINDECWIWQEAHPETLTAPLLRGHRKDVVLSTFMRAHPACVMIYGWQGLNGVVQQPLYPLHAWDYLDYSHGVGLIKDACRLGGAAERLSYLYRDPARVVAISKASDDHANKDRTIPTSYRTVPGWP